VPLTRMDNQKNKEQVMVRRAAVMALGRALRHEFESRQEEMPEHMRQLVAELETAGEPKNKGKSD
jgi:hypothetical protein